MNNWENVQFVAILTLYIATALAPWFVFSNQQKKKEKEEDN